MVTEAQWVGIDVSKTTLDVALRHSQQQLQVPNTAAGIASLRKFVGVEDSTSDLGGHG